MRKLATIRKISDIQPIPGADSIEVATVDGWKVVIRKGEFKVGDHAIYCEVDSLIPHHVAPFLSKDGIVRPFNRLRTVKLRGQISQGLLLHQNYDMPHHTLGADVTEYYGILKYDSEGSMLSLGCVPAGKFPSFIPKTYQERCQNIVNKIQHDKGQQFEVTEKLDGTSMTIYARNGVFHVCTRNLEAREATGSIHWEAAHRLGLKEKLLSIGDDIAIQGEVIGPKIQKNRYKLPKTDFYVFDIFDISTGRYILPQKRREIIKGLGLNHVPVVEEEYPLEGDIQSLLEMAEGTSAVYDTPREGLVFKSVDSPMTFKAISNKYLLKNG